MLLITILLFLNDFLKVEPQLLAQIKNKHIGTAGWAVFDTMEQVPSEDFHKNQNNPSLDDSEFFKLVSSWF